jgi:uncharacterized protein (DUF849 family)
MTRAVIITVAPNGARRLKRDHPQIPLTIAEIGRDAAQCVEAGAAMIHVHVRDADGAHILDADAYRDVTREIRAQVGVAPIVQITTESVGRYAPRQQMEIVEQVRPEAVSIALRELMPEPGAEREGSAFLHRLAGGECLVQHILYDAGDVLRFQDLVANGAIPPSHASALFVLGRYTAGQQSDPRDLLPFLDAWRLDLPWATCAFGKREAACVISAAAMGGHARVGFENNLHMPDGQMAPDNAALVRCVVAGTSAIGLRPASPDEARQVLSKP